MPVADTALSAEVSFGSRIHNQLGFLTLFGVLAAFTLSTMDGGDVAPRIISAVLLALTACYLSFPFGQRLVLSVPAVCLLLMACYGVVQTLWSPQKIVADGWSGVLFWFTAAAIAFLATQVFTDARAAARFRFLFVLFGSAVCLLDLMEQASHTSKYFWLIPSHYHAVFGSFAYWNNFAQFVELLLPVTLWMGLGGRQPVPKYIILGALQIGAVVASGSRAGTALVGLELVVVVLFAFARHRNKNLLFGVSLAIVLSVLFVYAAGFNEVIAKLQQTDQLQVRRDIDKSSLAMIGERPLTGWGLDTYVPVYRMFALYDDGTWVNRAHNDWLQWTAEGGIFFAGLMLVVFIWSVRPAIRSVWGIGLIAVCLHALVDYPFARFGVCAWYFALVAMLAVSDVKRERAVAGHLKEPALSFRRFRRRGFAAER
jgi:O-antigen ligase